MSIIVLALLSFLFNENSSLYLGGTEDKEEFTSPATGLTPEEGEILRRLSEKQARMATPAAEGKQEKPAPVEIYGQNLSVLQTIS
jgi:hypothetical protein